jgi:hypothetical protein
MSRPYVRHHWISTGLRGTNAYCFTCGIGERKWLSKIGKAPMIEWDCRAVRERETKKK